MYYYVVRTVLSVSFFCFTVCLIPTWKCVFCHEEWLVKSRSSTMHSAGLVTMQDSWVKCIVGFLSVGTIATTGEFWEEQDLTGASQQNCREEEMLIKSVGIGMGSSQRWEWYSPHPRDNKEGKFGGKCWSCECEAFWGRDAGTRECNSSWGCFWRKIPSCIHGLLLVLCTHPSPFILEGCCCSHLIQLLQHWSLLPRKKVEREYSDLIVFSLRKYISNLIHVFSLVQS